MILGNELSQSKQNAYQWGQNNKTGVDNFIEGIVHGESAFLPIVTFKYRFMFTKYRFMFIITFHSSRCSRRS